MEGGGGKGCVGLWGEGGRVVEGCGGGRGEGLCRVVGGGGRGEEETDTALLEPTSPYIAI